jgi:ankyrin repeat protein
MFGHPGAAVLLINKGAELNATDIKGRTALVHAIKGDYSTVVLLLLDAGADATARDEEGRSMMWYAKSRGRKDIVEMLKKHGAKK